MLCGIVVSGYADIGQGGNTVEELALIANKRRHRFSSSVVSEKSLDHRGGLLSGSNGGGIVMLRLGKALLVSHWPVETISARLLTTEIFRRQSANSNLSRSQAARQASLAVMEQTAKPERGQSYSYAHPMFWAPFVVVEDGG